MSEEDKEVQFDLPPEEEPAAAAKEEGAGEGGDGVEIVTASMTSHRAGEPTVTLPKDHFTLSSPTTTIRYRRSDNAARIIEDADKQYILEEADNDKTSEHEITIRQIHDTSEGVRFLRALYFLATAFWTGFLFVFCVMILLFVFLDMAIHFGITSNDKPEILAAIGICFSLIPFIRGLAAALVLAGVYVMVRGKQQQQPGAIALKQCNLQVCELFHDLLGHWERPSLGAKLHLSPVQSDYY